MSATDWPTRHGSWAARGLRVPARNALLADVVPPVAYGFERMMDNLRVPAGEVVSDERLSADLDYPKIAVVAGLWCAGIWFAAVVGLLLALSTVQGL